MKFSWRIMTHLWMFECSIAMATMSPPMKSMQEDLR